MIFPCNCINVLAPRQCSEICKARNLKLLTLRIAIPLMKTGSWIHTNPFLESTIHSMVLLMLRPSWEDVATFNQIINLLPILWLIYMWPAINPLAGRIPGNTSRFQFPDSFERPEKRRELIWGKKIWWESGSRVFKQHVGTVVDQEK